MTDQTRPAPVDDWVGALDGVATFTGATPTGVSVLHHGCVFVDFPGWGEVVPFTVAEIRNGVPVAYPDGAIQRVIVHHGRPERFPFYRHNARFC